MRVEGVSQYPSEVEVVEAWGWESFPWRPLAAADSRIVYAWTWRPPSNASLGSSAESFAEQPLAAT